jgi:hypothetical protein
MSDADLETWAAWMIEFGNPKDDTDQAFTRELGEELVKRTRQQRGPIPE